MDTSDNKFIQGSRRRYNRRWQPNINRSFDDVVSQFDHTTIVSASRRLFANDPIVTNILESKGFYSVGDAFKPKYTGGNKAWGVTGKDFLNNFYRVASTDGQDMNTLLYLISVSVDMDGECFLLLTTSKNGYPQVQPIPAYSVGQREDGTKKVTTGKYKGSTITKGIITQKNKRPIAYRVLGETKKDDVDIPAESIIHIKEQQYIGGQSRGLPLISSCINTFQDLKQSQDLELTKQLLLASLAFITYNETGSPDAFSDDNIDNDSKPSCETFDNNGGEIRFFRSGSGDKLEAISNNNPSDQWQAYQDRLTNACICGLGWSKDFLGMGDGNGVNTRLTILQVTKTIKDRQSLLMPVIERICSYAIAMAISLNLLEFDPDFYRWVYSIPPSLSVDMGRDLKSILEGYKAGLLNLTDYLQGEGKDLETHLTTRAIEEAKAILIRQEIEKEYKVTINPLHMRLTSNSEFQPTTTPTPTNEAP